MFQRGLHRTDDERREHLAELEKRGIVGDYGSAFTFLYEALSILDSKASSLLTFNAVGLTALAIWLEKIPLNLFHFTLDVAFLLFLISCVLCLRIVWLHWASTQELKNEEVQPIDLLRVRDERTVLYRWAWFLAVCAVVITGLATIHHTFETMFTVVYSWILHLPVDSSTSGSPGI